MTATIATLGEFAAIALGNNEKIMSSIFAIFDNVSDFQVLQKHALNMLIIRFLFQSLQLIKYIR